MTEAQNTISSETLQLADNEKRSLQIKNHLLGCGKEIARFQELSPDVYGNLEETPAPMEAVLELSELDWSYNDGLVEGRSEEGDGLWVGSVSLDGFNLTNLGVGSTLDLKSMSYSLLFEEGAPVGTMKIETNEGAAFFVLGKKHTEDLLDKVKK